MKNYKEKVMEAAEYIKTHTDISPGIGILTGTGLGESAESLEISDTFKYEDLPNFPVSTVESHHGRLLMGRMNNKQVIAMQGRFHLYEGYSPLEVTFPIRVMQQLGVKNLILTNAAGGLNPLYYEGDIMIIMDHINLTGANPLAGPNEESWGVRFPDMTRVYDHHLAELAEKAGKNENMNLQKGIYVGLRGPSLETPAETRFIRFIGADAVGFSTIQEVIAAVHADMRILGISTITNINIPDKPVPATVAEIIAVAEKTAPKIDKIIQKVVENLNDNE